MTTPDAPRGPRRPPPPGGAARPAGGGPRRPPRPGGAPAGPARPARSPRPAGPGPARPAPGGRPQPSAVGPARPSSALGTPRSASGGAARPSAPRPTSGPGSQLRPPSRAANTVQGLAEASRSNGRPRTPQQRKVARDRALVGGGILAVLVLVVGFCTRPGSDGGEKTATKSGTESPTGTGTGTTATSKPASGLAAEPAKAYAGWVDPKSSGEPWSTKVVGQLTFRGNPTRSYYGLGPVPKAPVVQWHFPETGGMCGNSPVGGQNKQWCGSGWTGQPSVWEQDGKTWVAVGTYDKNIHFFDAADGSNLIENHDMQDIIKGSVTRDPDGFPLLYSGSRHNFEILALDRDDKVPERLWTLTAKDVSPTKWNDDWDGSALVIDDYLFEGGENGQFHIVKLNRKMGDDGKVSVDPKIVFHAPGWDQQELSDLAGSGSRVNDVSIENSVAISGNTVYFSNSGGLLQGWDITDLKKDPASVKRTFRYWTGDDTDASVVIDKQGMLYVAQERERSSSYARSDEVGQLMKLDPTKPDDPLVWSVKDDRGIWATPAISGGVVVAPTDGGFINGVDQETGKVLWKKKLPGPTWSSPVIVDGVWIQGDCNGVLHGFDFSKPKDAGTDTDGGGVGNGPEELWKVQLEGCVESTPTVFKGQIFVGARGGQFYALGDAE